MILSLIDSNILHLSFKSYPTSIKRTVKNEHVTFKLKKGKEDEFKKLIITSSKIINFFGNNAKFYIQMVLDDRYQFGFWLESGQIGGNENTIFNLPSFNQKSLKIDMVVIM